MRLKVEDNPLAKRRRITVGNSNNSDASTSANADVVQSNALAASFPNQKVALSIFAEHSAEHFMNNRDKIKAAMVLRSEVNASFFISLDEDLRWEWLLEECK